MPSFLGWRGADCEDAVRRENRHPCHGRRDRWRIRPVETFTPPGGYAHDDLLDGVVIVGASAMHAEIKQGAATLSF
ncbi:hypothetical protein AMK01_CH02748 [Rhizobium sp. N6212]|nr:hypothetical protein AMK01_CH02748 [Rhizobium sp. N6212]ANK98231.1 hypothetical protein AMK00_CH02751 [Rhizobium sp. N621]ANL04311.1 hypothetical protein AMJ99_CH02779 [Rhizobium esperanzae]ANL10423.1 hypothetical protein AMJ98_CH02779 [Rhizobium sp. N1341]ANL22476.1 hypothetical protein AMJ96_CH02782 [Rhizobium sp. N113]ANM35154.1 hypothetical protein AMK04_CH02781 [Rhizobium sp. N871]ANM41266.1 hypothetical protein AMK03_CH02781 [Rhizobium sp. N741]